MVKGGLFKMSKLGNYLLNIELPVYDILQRD